MHWFGRLAIWSKTHVRTMDVITGSLMLAFVILTSESVGATSSFATPGLLFSFNGYSMLAWSIAACLPLMVRRTYPQMSAVAFVAIALIQLVAGPVIIFADGIGLIMLYCAIVHGEPQHARSFIVTAFGITLFAAAALTSATQIGPFLADPNNTLISADCRGLVNGSMTWSCGSSLLTTIIYGVTVMWSCVLATVVMAFWQRARRYTLTMMEDRNAALQSSEEEQQRIAQLAERARIARDMHDTVAHTLSIVIVQSDGGRYAGALHPDVAKRTMQTIQREASHALHDMRQLLGVFGGSLDERYASITPLLAQFRITSDHNEVEHVTSGTPHPDRLDTQTQTTMYRVVQESLTNVRKYAGSNVHVVVSEAWDEHEATIAVSDNGRGIAAALDHHKAGMGLIGMRERVQAAGGSLQAGPQLTGGFRVTAVLPYDHVAGPAADAHVTTMPARTASADPAQAFIDPPASTAAPSQSSGTGTSSSPAPPWDGLQSDIEHFLRPKLPSMQLGALRRRFNVIERMSHWAQTHYLATDCMMVTALIIWTWVSHGMTGSIVDFSNSGTLWWPRIMVTLLMLPLCLRRQAPEFSALLFATWSAVLLIFADTVPVAGMFAIVSVFSAVLYGKNHAWRWVGMAVVIDGVLVGVRVGAQALGYTTIVAFIPHISALTNAPAPLLWSSLGAAIFVIVLCFGAMASAQWSRSRGANALVLQARQEALRTEQERQRVLAANMERERIGSSIRSEVTHTLGTVIEAADQGLQMLQKYESDGIAPPPAQVESAFTTIGSEGRAALAHMRELLGVLHQTVQTDTPAGSADHAMNLKPPTSLDAQLGIQSAKGADTPVR